jgi:hypothetical protein|tara:strand:- start:1710 stop:1928 length:219 start_codon:yes stop_codon:yes gene_type:complete
MYEYTKQTIDGVIWASYKTAHEGIIFRFTNDEEAQTEITNFLKDIGKYTEEGVHSNTFTPNPNLSTTTTDEI